MRMVYFDRLERRQRENMLERLSKCREVTIGGMYRQLTIFPLWVPTTYHFSAMISTCAGFRSCFCGKNACPTILSPATRKALVASPLR